MYSIRRSSIAFVALLFILLLGIGAYPSKGLVLKVSSLGVVGEKERRAAGIISQDGAQSIEIPNASLWSYGDSLLGTIDSGGKIHFSGVINNTMAITCDLDASDSIDRFIYLTDVNGRPRQPIEPDPTEDGKDCVLWPAHGIYINGKIQMFYQIVSIINPRALLGFEVLGVGMAEARFPVNAQPGEFSTLKFRRLKHKGGYIFWREEEGGYGIHVLDIGDGYAYVYGRYNRQKRFTYGEEEQIKGNPDDPLVHPLRLMRVKRDQFTRRESYEYLADTKGSWSKDPKDAIDIISVVGNFQIFYNQYLKTFLCVYTDDFSNQIKIRRAKSLWGPFGMPEVIFKHISTKKGEFISTMYVHPEYNRKKGKIFFITYCVSRMDTRPILLKVELK
ncbi:MAG: DUF4185 domain-containing protein [Deltaproteobacteria bacterium]|nr:DUF4185 domain-containing protein [Deltaproteobacteria bacterium]